MDSLIERADVYVSEVQRQGGYGIDDIRSAYEAGSVDAYKELVRWHDLSEGLPEYYKAVEIKHIRFGEEMVSVAWLSTEGDGDYSWTVDGTTASVDAKEVVGWRPIYL